MVPLKLSPHQDKRESLEKVLSAKVLQNFANRGQLYCPVNASLAEILHAHVLKNAKFPIFRSSDFKRTSVYQVE